MKIPALIFTLGYRGTGFVCFSFLATCARLSCNTYSAFESTLNSTIVSYRIGFVLSWLNLTHAVVLFNRSCIVFDDYKQAQLKRSLTDGRFLKHGIMVGLRACNMPFLCLQKGLCELVLRCVCNQSLADLHSATYIRYQVQSHLFRIHRESKKGDTILLSISLLNIDRFSHGDVGSLLIILLHSSN